MTKETNELNLGNLKHYYISYGDFKKHFMIALESNAHGFYQHTIVIEDKDGNYTAELHISFIN